MNEIGRSPSPARAAYDSALCTACRLPTVECDARLNAFTTECCPRCDHPGYRREMDAPARISSPEDPSNVG